jgi:MerR family transcriptional regulator, light-induced transcriptional regulator
VASPGLSPYLTTTQAATALAVSVSTVKRWVDDGLLPAHVTAGGHRKLLRAEVQAFARQHLPLGEPAGQPTAADLGVRAAVLAEALATGAGSEARALVRRAYSAGVSVEVLADRVVAPAMAAVGHRWAAGRLDVWEEHRGTQLCSAALHDLKALLEPRAERGRPVAVGAAPAGDPYTLPTQLAQLVLLDAGWQAVNLGPNTPLASLARAVRELRPRLAWVSASFLPDEATFVADFRAFYRTAEGLGVAVAVGGRALAEGVRSQIVYTTFGDGLTHLAAFARTLHPRPRRPRRGRPGRRGQV